MIYKRIKKLLKSYTKKNKIEYTLPDKPDILLVVGAESTATRLITTLLSQHSQIESIDASNHEDLLDVVWQSIEREDSETDTIHHLQNILKKTSKDGNNKVLITRRSIPHAYNPQSKAAPFQFPDLSGFINIASQLSLTIACIVTVRSPFPHLISWTLKRNSAQNSINLAQRQYQKAYRYIFEEIPREIPIWFISQESLFINDLKPINNLFPLLGLPSEKIKGKAIRNSNKSYYRNYSLHHVRH